MCLMVYLGADEPMADVETETAVGRLRLLAEASREICVAAASPNLVAVETDIGEADVDQIAQTGCFNDASGSRQRYGLTR